MSRVIFIIFVMSFNCILSSPDQSDTDTNSGSETSDTSDIDMGLDNKDPNLHNPMSRHGYGGDGSMKSSSTGTSSPSAPLPAMKPTLPSKTLGEQTVRAALELGIVVGVALMVGLGFMAMVGMELLWDKVLDEYRRLLKKPKPLPDVERLHPAELVGKFSRYK